MNRIFRIAIDARSLNYKGTGLAAYTEGIIKNLYLYDKNYMFFLIVEKGTIIDDYIKYSNNIEIIPTIIRRGDKLRRDFWMQFIVPMILINKKIDLFHGLDYYVPYFNFGFKTIVTLHDTTVFKDYDGRPSNKKLIIKILQRLSAKNADYIVTVSDYSKKDLIKIFPFISEKISFIWNGIDEKYYQPLNNSLIDITLSKLQLKEGYLLYYGGFNKHKNVELLLNSFKRIQESNKKIKLVIVGNLNNDNSLINLCIDLNITENVHFFGFASIEEIKILLDNCLIYIFPSLNEGFGLTIVEAMARKALIISSSNSSLTEIGGDAIRYFKNNSIESLTDEINKLLYDKRSQSILRTKAMERSKYFSWPKSVSKLISIYNKLLEINPNEYC